MFAYRKKVVNSPSNFKAVSKNGDLLEKGDDIRIMPIPKAIALNTNAFLTYLGFEPLSDTDIMEAKKSFGLG